jgi:hypothetical protein
VTGIWNKGANIYIILLLDDSTMDLKARYEFAYGHSRELSGGELDKMQNAERFEELMFPKEESKIIQPKFIGVYQFRDVVLHGDEEREHKDEIEKESKSLEKLAHSIADTALFANKGFHDNLNPRLIHIGFDDNIWSPELVRQAIEDKLGRIAISTYTGMPDFYEKNTSAGALINEKGIELLNDLEDVKEMARRLKSQLDDYENEMKPYGLTRDEYAFLQIMRKLGKSNSDVISESKLINIYSDAMKRMKDGNDFD